ncbi:hypothetical protein [Halosolutus gelatinilyticus]|uniref:hypothetical protein n=1 Tax=Halosolutus gelatinilyticus TaxID=2931975 RepID=UPI001FF58BBE|nr:hypothetical protein [Halosolutus gelatinilyticus]
MTVTRITRRRAVLSVVGLTPLLGSGCLDNPLAEDDHEHEHDDPPWEWGGLYELRSGMYTYTYYEGPDPEMHLAVVPTDESGDHGLFHAGETATGLFEEDEAGTVVADGDAVQPSSDTLYRVDFEPSGETTIELRVASDGFYSIFTAHVPEEFEAELRSEADDEVTPIVTELHSSHSHGNESHDHDH